MALGITKHIFFKKTGAIQRSTANLHSITVQPCFTNNILEKRKKVHDAGIWCKPF